MAARSFDEFCGYALELVVGGLRGLRGALGRVITNGEASSRHRASRAAHRGAGRGPAGDPAADPWTPAAAADRVAGEASLRDALAASPPLPHSYADDRVVLLTRDPHTLFAYWDLAPGAEQPAGAAAARLVLRIHDLSLLHFADAHPLRHQDIGIDRPVGSCYVPLDGAAGTYRAEIGWHWSDGRFVTRVRSGTVTTARAAAPGNDPTRWMTVARIAGGARPSATQSARPSAQAAAPPEGAPVSRAPASTPPSRAPASEEQHRRER